MAAGGLDDGMVDGVMGCYHTWGDRGLHARHIVVVGEDRNSLAEARGAEAAHTENPSASEEDRADSIRLLPDSDAGRVVNTVVVPNPSMVLRHPNHCPRIQMMVVAGHRRNILLRAMRSVLTVDTEELPHGITNHPRDCRNCLFQPRPVSRLEREVQNRLHSRSALQVYFDAKECCREHHSAVNHYCIPDEKYRTLRCHYHCYPHGAKEVFPSWIVMSAMHLRQMMKCHAIGWG